MIDDAEYSYCTLQLRWPSTITCPRCVDPEFHVQTSPSHIHSQPDSAGQDNPSSARIEVYRRENTCTWMGQVGPIPKEDCLRDDSRRHNSKMSSSGFPKPDRCKGVGTLVI